MLNNASAFNTASLADIWPKLFFSTARVCSFLGLRRPWHITSLWLSIAPATAWIASQRSLTAACFGTVCGGHPPRRQRHIGTQTEPESPAAKAAPAPHGGNDESPAAPAPTSGEVYSSTRIAGGVCPGPGPSMPTCTAAPVVVAKAPPPAFLCTRLS